MRVKIEVTQEDIDLGVVADGDSCPIARSLRRIFPDLDVYVGGCYFDLIDEGIEIASVTLPKTAQRFIDRFDGERATVRPETFYVTGVPPEAFS